MASGGFSGPDPDMLDTSFAVSLDDQPVGDELPIRLECDVIIGTFDRQPVMQLLNIFLEGGTSAGDPSAERRRNMACFEGVR